jgi:hypothetical protein
MLQYFSLLLAFLNGIKSSTTYKKNGKGRLIIFFNGSSRNYRKKKNDEDQPTQQKTYVHIAQVNKK